MVIWTRWGILGLLIPTALIVIAILGAERMASQRTRDADQKPVKQAPVGDDGVEEAPPEKDPEGVKAAERKLAADLATAKKRAQDTGYLIGGLASAAILWPLGRRLNRVQSSSHADPWSGQATEIQGGGGHAMFFIPLEYWGFIWAAIGLVKFFG